MKRLMAVAFVLVMITACGDATAPSPVKSLQVRDITVGTGAEAVSGKSVAVDYTGWIYDATAIDHKGTKFDASADHGAPIDFVLGIGMVIKGWDQGIVGMKVGGTRELIIPPSLGYGRQGYGPIPANSALVFEIQLRSVQ